MPPKRIKGTKLSLLVGAQEMHSQATNVLLDNEEATAGVTTFADALAGGARQHFLSFTSIQSTDVDSVWRYLYSNPGAVIPYVFRPHGNAVATESEPHFTGTVKVNRKPPIGGEAGVNNEFTFDYRLDCQEEPTLYTGVATAPAILTVTPNPVQQGKFVTITGVNFLTATAVKFGAVTADDFVNVGRGEVWARVPAGTAAGVVQVTVVGPGGTSAAVPLTVTA